jgi:hypothetical protein
MYANYSYSSLRFTGLFCLYPMCLLTPEHTSGLSGLLTLLPVACCCICNASLEAGMEAGEGGHVVSKCAHQFHRACVEGLLLSHMAEDAWQARGEGQDARGRAEVARCPACGDALSVDMRPQSAGFRSRKKRAGKSLLGKIGAHELPTSTKLEAVAAEIRAMMARGNGSKAVIFSQYTRMLDLLTIRLSGDGVGVARISGDMTRQQRDVNLDAFRRHNSTRVIMISLKAGGEGLNLQNADHIFVVDPWWNPAAELQAIDRVHRIGQTKRVTAIRFIIKDSIEERIVQLQDKKKLVMAGALDGDTAAMQQLTAQVVVTVVFALLPQLSLRCCHSCLAPPQSYTLSQPRHGRTLPVWLVICL